VILLAMLVLKFHEKSPAPIPIEVLLYEAWMTDAGTLRLTGLEPPVRAVKAHLYAQRDLCDLAKAETDALADADPQRTREDVRATMDTIGSSPTDEEIRSFVAASRALGHGSTALCYLSREEKEKAHEEIQRFVDAAEEAGFPPADTALLRAYLAYEDGDIEATRRYLEQAKESDMLDEDDREDVDELLRYLREENDRDALTDFYDKAFFAAFTARLCLRQLEQSGVAEDLETTPVYSAAYGWVVTAARTIETARNAVPSFSDATEQGKSFLESLFD
jgi:hypothetical protein